MHKIEHAGAVSGVLKFRLGTPADSYAVFNVFEESLSDLSRRLGSTAPASWQDPAMLAKMWAERSSLYDHLARTADHFWVAEQEGRVAGFARSIVRGGLRMLTELFVSPGVQSSGLGRELLRRAVPADTPGVTRRLIIATPDIRAQALYLKAGVYPRFPIYYFGRSAPEPARVTTDLHFQPAAATPETLAILGRLDQELLGHRRDEDHTWLLGDRQGYLYYRHGRPVGYGYLGVRNGPFALLEAADFPAVLAHAESEAAQAGRECGFEVPMVNQVAADYLLGRGYKLDSFVAMLMTDAPFGKFENYVVTSPPFIL